ncbi:hypothetical protein VC83_04805 [Pseudogymnoascus destructans]|uniref:Uncharacterized protein n=1 Tax=Pseudogymnoascus destructans TaxID=655981 RepID=A0A177A5G6_9PEZI|nr:uncharacterized protein VC83_04805 [Pseudogymnoascus destructans]OAF57436.1 hypothetical protein VC83_04805 [Pseudogymnoascus destructans]
MGDIFLFLFLFAFNLWFTLSPRFVPILRLTSGAGANTPSGDVVLFALGLWLSPTSASLYSSSVSSLPSSLPSSSPPSYFPPSSSPPSYSPPSSSPPSSSPPSSSPPSSSPPSSSPPSSCPLSSSEDTYTICSFHFNLLAELSPLYVLQPRLELGAADLGATPPLPPVGSTLVGGVDGPPLLPDLDFVFSPFLSLPGLPPLFFAASAPAALIASRAFAASTASRTLAASTASAASATLVAAFLAAFSAAFLAASAFPFLLLKRLSSFVSFFFGSIPVGFAPAFLFFLRDGGGRLFRPSTTLCSMPAVSAAVGGLARPWEASTLALTAAWTAGLARTSARVMRVTLGSRCRWIRGGILYGVAVVLCCMALCGAVWCFLVWCGVVWCIKR